MLKYKTERIIQDEDWDDLVGKIYGKPYTFQQQDGCKSRGTYTLEIPEKIDWEDAERVDSQWPDTIPEIVNGREMGPVNFKAWLARDPKEWNGSKEDNRYIDMWWQRNFYPQVEMIAFDLKRKGLIESGRYIINIDW